MVLDFQNVYVRLDLDMFFSLFLCLILGFEIFRICKWNNLNRCRQTELIFGPNRGWRGGFFNEICRIIRRAGEGEILFETETQN